MERRKDHFRSQYLYESPQDREADLARHAALSVLLDREALMTRALVGQESLPQTRRRFTTKFMLPDSNLNLGSGSTLSATSAAAVRDDRFTIPITGSLGTVNEKRRRSDSSDVAAAITGNASGSTGASPVQTTTTTATFVSVQRDIVDVHETDDSGWYFHLDDVDVERGQGRKSASVSASASASTTPDRARRRKTSVVSASGSSGSPRFRRR
ncbi:hypothetical protein MPDQ_000205 [Monascus purpureus]|uniref:Uncharacterized protein n=1 Tax=Monascus purpureus TaxID=5098 RepID=A0A507R444_MONPU|nr:hypothetical protein MPDQ_000205 [Monascus purpureus]